MGKDHIFVYHFDRWNNQHMAGLWLLYQLYPEFILLYDNFDGKMRIDPEIFGGTWGAIFWDKPN